MGKGTPNKKPEGNTERIKILLVDGQKMFRDVLYSLLGCQSDMEVVSETENGVEAVDLAQKIDPDIVLMGIELSGISGIEATRQILRKVPGVTVIAVSSHRDRRYLEGMLKAGASAYLSKDCAFEKLIRTIRSMFHKKSHLTREISEEAIRECAEQPKGDYSPGTISFLTEREREILRFIAEGFSTKSIASHLDLSPKTVETFRQHLTSKLNVTSVAQLTKIAIREGLSSLDVCILKGSDQNSQIPV